MSEGKFAEQLARAKARVEALPAGFFVVTRPLVTTEGDGDA